MLLTTKMAAQFHFEELELFVIESQACWYLDGVEILRRPRALWARA